MIDVQGDPFEFIADRIVRDGSQVDDRIDALEGVLGKFSDVRLVLDIDFPLRDGSFSRQAMAEITDIEAYEHGIGVRSAKPIDDRGTDIAHVSGDKDLQNPLPSATNLFQSQFQVNHCSMGVKAK
jgi:hypothetical protein